MKLGSGKSSNVEDRRGMGLPVIGGGIGAVVLVVLALLLGQDPREVLQQTAPQNQAGPGASKPGMPDPESDFVRGVLFDTEESWHAIFREQVGSDYREPKLVIFDNPVQSACGLAQSAVGPFYCPLDGTVYIDLAFYRDLKERFAAPGDFAQAYVIAHEVGHHVQNQLGISEQVQNARQQASREEGNAISVRQELQADCFAGVWGNHAQRTRQILEPGDVEEALNAASAIGDDRLQRQAQGHVVPESFTHGSSAQRVRWFRRGFESGLIKDCDAFGARTL